MTDYSLADIIDYLQEHEENSDTCDAVYALIHVNVSRFIEIKLEEFSYNGQQYAEKTFHLNKKFIAQIQDDYYEGKCFYHHDSEITDTHSGEKFLLSVAYMNDSLLEVSLELVQDSKSECCEDPEIIEVLAKIEGDFNVFDKQAWSVQTPADLGLGKKRKLNFKMCKNCNKILD